jgi:hypothetical protein
MLIGLVSLGWIGVHLYAWPVATSEPTSPTPPYRAFSDASYWNTPLPAAAPVDPDSEGIIDFLEQHSRYNYVRLAGTDSSGRWGNPIYWSGQDDPVYDVVNTCRYQQPPEFSNVRIPVGARPDPTSDSAMSIYNVERGIVYAMHKSSYDAEHDAWSACGGTVYYLRSNGLHGKLRRSNEPRNTGHRGVPPPTYAVRFDEVEWGSIDHVLKIAVSAASSDHVFPMVGSDGVSADPSAPPEGARLRIKRSVDLETLDLSPPALVIAQTLQRYGAVIGDRTSGKVNLKVENTVAEGRGQLWDGVLSAHSLSAIPLDDYEVVRLGYRP